QQEPCIEVNAAQQMVERLPPSLARRHFTSRSRRGGLQSTRGGGRGRGSRSLAHTKFSSEYGRNKRNGRLAVTVNSKRPDHLSVVAEQQAEKDMKIGRIRQEVRGAVAEADRHTAGMKAVGLRVVGVIHELVRVAAVVNGGFP